MGPCEREPGSAGCLFLKQIWDKFKYIFIWSQYVVVISSLLTVHTGVDVGGGRTRGSQKESKIDNTRT